MTLAFPKGKKRKRIKRDAAEEQAFEQPRNITLRDPKYILAVHDFPCVLRGTKPSDPAHISWGGLKGIAHKTPDNRIVPLHHDLHVEQSNMSETEFWCGRFAVHKSFAAKCEKEWHEAHYPVVSWIGDEFDIMRAIICYAEKQYALWKKGIPAWL